LFQTRCGAPVVVQRRLPNPLTGSLPDFFAMRSLLLALFAACAAGTELTKDSWDAAVAGKTVFVKFLAPW